MLVKPQTGSVLVTYERANLAGALGWGRGPLVPGHAWGWGWGWGERCGVPVRKLAP